MPNVSQQNEGERPRQAHPAKADPLAKEREKLPEDVDDKLEEELFRQFEGFYGQFFV